MREPPQRQHRVLELWSWLPAFRMVAEREYVKGASRELHVSASTLSRAVGLVEDRLGRQLFDRVGRNLRLNRDGRELLEALRDGMRRIDDGVARVTETVFRGDFRIAVEGDQLLSPMAAALVRLHREHLGLAFTVWPAPVPMTQLEPGLLQGRFDLAFVLRVPQALSRRRLRIEKVGVVTYGIYCGPRHPLYAGAGRALTVADVTPHAFVAPTPSADGTASDEWPADIERQVALYLPALAPAMAVCATGDLLAVLPDAVARGGGLRRLRLDLIKPQTVHAVRRPVIGPDDLAGLVLAEVKSELPTRSRASSARGKTGGGRREPGERRP